LQKSCQVIFRQKIEKSLTFFDFFSFCRQILAIFGIFFTILPLYLKFQERGKIMKIPNEGSFITAFRHLLCEERKKRNFSQCELAKRSGLSRQCMSLFESGRRSPTFFSLLNLAKGFDMPLIRLISMLLNKADYYENRGPMVTDSHERPRWRV
jgi:DNA-binding XRE family transcriptional regulator